MTKDYPLFVKWYDAVKFTFEVTERMPKWIRRSVSERLIDASLSVMDRILRALYAPEERKKNLKEANFELEKLRVLWRLCADQRWIAQGQYERIESDILETGKMIGE